jgi:ribosomal protein S18 acetylase RimI-like enzyme
LPNSDDIRYVIDLSKKHYEEIGFLPAPRLEAYQQAGQLWMANENDERCGFMVWGRGWPVLRVYQVCIQYDAQRREHGFSLVRRLIAKADNEGYEAISCYVADDIDANSFWRACGFSCVGQRDNGNRRKRLHNHWVMRMPNPSQSNLFHMAFSGAPA